MRFLTTLLIGSVLALPAMAQTTPATDMPATPATPMHRMKHGAMHKPMGRHMAARTGTPGNPTENDKGPFTPEANRAYDGGGAVLTGQPGGPPPPASDVLTQPTGRPIR